jgi:hypothetical protein
MLAAVAAGALVGALIGGLIGGLTYQPCTDPGCWDFGRELDVWVGAFLGVLPGVAAGMVLGFWLWRRNPQGGGSSR